MSDRVLQEMKDLAGLLGHHNPQVRWQASQMATSLSASADNHALIAQTDLIKSMAKQMTDVKDIAREIYKGLINLAENEELYVKMLQTNLIGIAMECLRVRRRDNKDSKTDLEMRELILMFLTNMSRDEKGASALMQEGEEVEGLHVRRLLNWFTQFVPATGPGILDPNAYCAHILTNVSQIAAGRRLLMNRDRGYIAQLLPQLSSSNPIRRLGSFNLIKNCFMEDSHHEALLNPKLGLLPAMLEPIIGNEPFLHGEEEYKGIDPKVRALMKADKRRDPDPQVRCLVYEILLLCARHKPSRVFLRASAIYPILRHAHDEEKVRGADDPASKELDELLGQLVPFFILDEDDAQHPDQKEAEKKKQRIEQLKQINQAEEKSEEGKEEKEEKEEKSKEEEEDPIHYLDHTDPTALPPALPPQPASSVAPGTNDQEDEEFGDVQPFGADETAQLGEITHNVKTLDIVKQEQEAAAKEAARAAAQPTVYAEAAADSEDEEEEEVPPPLADESGYMDALD